MRLLCLSCVSVEQYFQINVFKSGWVGGGVFRKKYKKAAWPNMSFSLEEGGSKLLHTMN